MVRSPTGWAVAVRRPDGTIHVESHAAPDRWPRLRASLVRGPLALVEAVTIGMRGIRIALREASGTEVPRDAITMVFAPVAVAILGFFIALPGVVASGLSDPAGDVVEAGTRAAVLLVYLLGISRAEQSKRLFGYHGAEHMAIAAFERHGRLPTAAEAAAESPIHLRCGTDFVALFVMVCAVLFSFVARRPIWAGGLGRVALVPVVAAVAYEVMRLCARHPRQAWARLVTWPGRALQRVTTRPPDPGQLAVAMAALAATATTSGAAADPDGMGEEA